MKRLFLLTLLFHLSLLTFAQSKTIEFQVFGDDSIGVEDVRVNVYSLTGEESIVRTDGKGLADFEFDCETGYYLTFYAQGYHLKKINLKKPCTEIKEEEIQVYLSSGLLYK